mgnify:CR=1 FL=1
MVGMYDIFTAEDPKEKSMQYGKGIGQAVGVYPEDFPGGTDVTGDVMPPGHLPLSQKPKDLEKQVDLGKTYDPHGNIPSHKLGQTPGTPLPPGHGAGVLEDRPMYAKDDKGRWVQEQPPKPPITAPKPKDVQRGLGFLKSPKFWTSVAEGEGIEK